MSHLITIQIPHNWVKGIPEGDLTLKEVFRMGIYEYKVKRAIQLYKEEIGSLGYIAEQLGIQKQDLIREFRSRNIEPAFSEITLQEELGQ